MATTPALVPVEEYLRTVYRPDRDYVDGEVLERNMGEKPHARLQKFLSRWLERFEDELNAEVFIEQRLQINSSRYRVPDVLLVSGDTSPDIVHQAPILCIEILSSEDPMRRIEDRVADYFSIGVPTTWAIDPWRRTAFTSGANGQLHEVRDTLTVPNTAISITVDAIFAELDRLETRSTAPKPRE